MQGIQDLRPPDGELKSRGAPRSGDCALRQARAEQVTSPSGVQRVREDLTELDRQRAEVGQIRFSSTVLALQEECDKVILQFQDEAQRRAKQSKFSDTLLR